MKIIVDNLALNYTDLGKGEVMLMLHGWGVDSSSMNGLANYLAKTNRVILMDLPGFGGSSLPTDVWDVDQYAKCVRAFIDKLGLNIDVLLGHSFGGRITIKLVGNSIIKPKKVILIGSAGIKDSTTCKQSIYKMVAKAGKITLSLAGLKQYQNKWRNKLYEKVGSFDYLKAGPLKDTFLRVIDEDLTCDAARISVPTLLIWGESDTETPLVQAKKLNELIKGSVLKVISGAGHYVFQDKPNAVQAIIKDFM